MGIQAAQGGAPALTAGLPVQSKHDRVENHSFSRAGIPGDQINPLASQLGKGNFTDPCIGTESRQC